MLCIGFHLSKIIFFLRCSGKANHSMKCKLEKTKENKRTEENGQRIMIMQAIKEKAK